MTKTVAIVGTHKDTRELAPYGDTSIDIWLFNEAGQADWAKRVSALFQVHIPAVYKNPLNRCDTRHWDWLQQPHDFPIYMLDIDPEVPASAKYPQDEILKALPCEKRMFTCTAAYAFSLAAFLKYEKVMLYGIEVVFDSEYNEQREAVAYWVGFLQGRGIIVDRHCADDLFVHSLYGREGLWLQSDETYKKRLANLAVQVEKARYYLEKAQRKSPNELKKAMTDYGIARGRQVERQRYADKVKAMIEVSGTAVLDKTELERASKDLLPLIDNARLQAERAVGAKTPEKYFQAVFASSALAGQWHENQDMLKEIA